MKTYRTVLAGLACAAILAATTVAASDAGKVYGEGVKLQHATPIQDLLARPDQFVGKTVRVDGVVSAVCQEMGCWIELADPEAKTGVRFKVDDGVIVFPVSAKGKRASAEGTFVRADGATAHENADLAAPPADKHAADPAQPAETPQTYLVRATGAIIY